MAQPIVPSALVKRGEVSDDDVFPRHAGLVTPLYSGCPRQWYRLHTKPHQSPIRVKVVEQPLIRSSVIDWRPE